MTEAVPNPTQEQQATAAVIKELRDRRIPHLKGMRLHIEESLKSLALAAEQSPREVTVHVAGVSLTFAGTAVGLGKAKRVLQDSARNTEQAIQILQKRLRAQTEALRGSILDAQRPPTQDEEDVEIPDDPNALDEEE